MTESVAWEHRDASQATARSSVGGAELEPMGSNAGLFKGFAMPPPRSQATLEAALNYPFFSNMGSGVCTVDRIESPCYMFSVDAVTLRAVDQPTPKPQKPKPVKPTPGLNAFTGEIMKKNYGNTRFARYGSGVIEFSSTPGQFAGAFVSSQFAKHDTNPSSAAPTIPFGNIFLDMESLLRNAKCSSFISDLIKTAEEITRKTAYSYDAGELIKKIATSFDGVDGGYRLFDDGSGAGSAGGDIWMGSAEAHIHTSTLLGPITARAVRQHQFGYALTGLHETIHLAGGGNNRYNGGGAFYTDYVLARSVFRMFKNPKDNPDDPANLHYPPGDSHLVYDYGVIWDRHLKNNCSPESK